MKTDKNYKMPKPVKAAMATIVDDKERNAYKRSMIEAHLYEVASRPKAKKSKNDKDET